MVFFRLTCHVKVPEGSVVGKVPEGSGRWREVLVQMPHQGSGGFREGSGKFRRDIPCIQLISLIDIDL